jgi:protein MAK16
MAPKRARREETRERKALAAAKLEKQIEKELINRLKSGNYTEDMLNVNEEIWKKVLDQRAKAERGEEEEESEEEEEEEEEREVEFVSDDEGILSGEEEFEDWLGEDGEMEEETDEEVDGKRKAPSGANPRRKIARVEIEYEEEREETTRERLLA